MGELFEGPFYEYLRQSDPLGSANYYKHGSSSTLFINDGRLFRLTRQGCGHSFIASESSLGNPNVTRVVYDFGPVAPSDEDVGEHYWLAEVEWLQDLDPLAPSTEALVALLEDLTDGEPQLEGSELEQFGRRCAALATSHGEFRGLLTTLARMAEFALHHQAMADINPDNLMVRPKTREYVLADPICDHYFPLNDKQLGIMEAIKSRVHDQK